MSGEWGDSEDIGGGGMIWFSGRTKGGSVVTNRVLRRGEGEGGAQRNLTGSEEGEHHNSAEPKRRGGRGR